MVVINITQLRELYYHILFIWTYVLLSLCITSKGSDLSIESDEVEFTFLTTVNQSRLHQNDYHVISLNLPFANESYFLQLSQPQDLFTPDHLDIPQHEVSQYRCLFSGTLASSQGEPVGLASLSSCFHETGFEGLLSVGNVHYQVAPSSHHLQKRSANKVYNKGGSKVTIKHQIKKPSVSASKASRSDSRQVPEDKLKQAREQMVKDQEALNDERDEDDDSDERDDNINEILSISEDNDNPLEVETVFGTLRQANKKRRTKNRSNGKAARVIELAIFTDEAFYRKWSTMYPQDTVKKINQYILALVNNMNYLYQQPSMEPRISFRLVNVGIQQNIPRGLQPSSNAERYLDSFCAFAGKKDKNGAIWDHAMMLTGLDMKDSVGNDNLGIAFTAVMCLRYYSCSVVKYNKGFESSFTAAHEMGHSLGMEHDGEAMNKKCDPAKFLMAAIAGVEQVTWSQCSNNNVKNFLVSGDPRANYKDPNGIPRCLTKRGSKRSGIRYRTGKWPGSIFDVNKQCQQACDHCVPNIKNEKPYNNICKTLYCKKPSGEIIPAHPALEGTSCGQGGQNLCRNGKCK